MNRVLAFPAPAPAPNDPPQHSRDVSERGVWCAPYEQDGRRLVIAIDSAGRRIGAISLMPGLRPSLAKAMLEELLDAVDPVGSLELVR